MKKGKAVRHIPSRGEVISYIQSGLAAEAARLEALGDVDHNKNIYKRIYAWNSLSSAAQTTHNEARQIEQEDAVSQLTDDQRKAIATQIFSELTTVLKLELLEQWSKDPDVRLLLEKNNEQ